jgi:hypothetical protein
MGLPFAPFLRHRREMNRQMFVFGHEFGVLGLTQQQQQESPSSQHSSTLLQ